ncbi:hypothetical protein BJY04DRAFT_35446 [Aspergillus karnatakaensis]|uniref:uncharacterized protein n=1 Tax=Aspergillus karnatakaensis TaxID=1810916 RepID=UPI003CCE37C6
MTESRVAVRPKLTFLAPSRSSRGIVWTRPRSHAVCHIALLVNMALTLKIRSIENEGMSICFGAPWKKRPLRAGVIRDHGWGFPCQNNQ